MVIIGKVDASVATLLIGASYPPSSLPEAPTKILDKATETMGTRLAVAKPTATTMAPVV